MAAKTNIHGLKHLEITMRDVLDGLEDAASYVNFQSVPDSLQILSIEPPGRAIQPREDVINITLLDSIENTYRSSNIVDYLMQRELKKSA